ncbi:hypothetical protein MMPV_008657 [Pyropia vietnamensis]
MPLIGAPGGRRRPPPLPPSTLIPYGRLSPHRRFRRWVLAAAARVRGYHKAPPPPGCVVAALWVAAAVVIVITLCAAQGARRVRVAEAGLAGEVLGELRALAHVRPGDGGDGDTTAAAAAIAAAASAIRRGRGKAAPAATGAVAPPAASDASAVADDSVAPGVPAEIDATAAAAAVAAAGAGVGDREAPSAGEEGDEVPPPPPLDEVPTRASLCSSLTPVSPPSSPLCGLSALSRSPGLAALLYAHPARLHAEVLTSPTGAIRLNRAHDGADAGGAAAAAPFYLEFQHHGGDFVAAGLDTANLTLLRAGLFTLDWGVRALRDVTAFEVGGGGRPPLAARAALLLRDAGVCGGYRRQRLEPLLRRLAFWAADVEGDSFKYQAQFTHQIWIRAATYAYLAALFPPNDPLQPLLATAHARYTAAALDGQSPAGGGASEGGVWKERGAFDAHYQGVSTLYAARAAAAAASTAERRQILDALAAGLPRLLQAIGPDGGMSVVGSARVAHERSRDGRPKTLDVKGTATALLYARALLGDGTAAAGSPGEGGRGITEGTVGWPPPPGVGVRAALAPAAMAAAARKYGSAHTARFRASLRAAVHRGPDRAEVTVAGETASMHKGGLNQSSPRKVA